MSKKCKNPTKWDFRDVSAGIQTLRNFLLGRKFVFHHRFPPLLAPRSIPPPEIPRGPDYKYADQWYGNRDVLNSVKPPVVAPVIYKGFKPSPPSPCYPQKPSTGDDLKFPSELPIPGCVWWFDAHCYYKEVSQTPCGVPPRMPVPPPPISPCAPRGPPCPPPPPPPPCPCPPPEMQQPADPCAAQPPCQLEPCKAEKIIPVKPPEICDPCKDDGPKKKC